MSATDGSAVTSLPSTGQVETMGSQQETPWETSRSSRLPLRERFLPLHRPWIEDADIDSVVQTLRSGWLTMGNRTLEFEDEFAGFVGAKYALGVNSGTAGLHLALDAIGLGQADEVIMSVYAFPAAAAAVLHLGGQPVFVDIRADTLTLDPEQVRAKITARTRAILPVHLAGTPSDMDPILELAARHDLKVIEDAAHALPAQYNGRPVGSIGDLTVFSFHQNGIITTGDGGMVTTDIDAYADRLRSRRLHGMAVASRRSEGREVPGAYEVLSPGYKYSMTDLAAALGIQQLHKASMFHAIRSYYVTLYQLGLSDLPELTLPEPAPSGQPAWHQYIIQLNLDRLAIDRDTFIHGLGEENIGSAIPCVPMHLHPYYRETFGFRPEDFPCALRAWERAVALPLYPRMSEADVWDVIRAVRQVVETQRGRRS
jgi:perosamine synthetase